MKKGVMRVESGGNKPTEPTKSETEAVTTIATDCLSQVSLKKDERSHLITVCKYIEALRHGCTVDEAIAYSGMNRRLHTELMNFEAFRDMQSKLMSEMVASARYSLYRGIQNDPKLAFRVLRARKKGEI